MTKFKNDQPKQLLKFGKVDLEAVTQKLKENQARQPMFTEVPEDDDVRLNRDIGGHWNGSTFREMAEDFEGRRVLAWILKANFDAEIKEIASRVLNETSY